MTRSRTKEQLTNRFFNLPTFKETFRLTSLSGVRCDTSAVCRRSLSAVTSPSMKQVRPTSTASCNVSKFQIHFPKSKLYRKDYVHLYNSPLD
ncbi:hypothetical protein SprV_0802625900 [Sparganum proliferum]